jgi:hypothetical protein
VSAPGTDAPVADNNGSQPDQQTTPDPWTQTLEGVDEVYRPHVEQAINPLREQFGPRLELADRLEPLSDYADHLLALHGMADDEGNSLEDILGVASMLQNLDPENPEAPANKMFADWFYEVGDALGLLDPEDGNGEGEGEFEDDDGEGGFDDTGDDVTQQLTARLEQAEARIAQAEARAAQADARAEQAEAAPRIQAIQQEIGGLIEKAIDEHRLGGKDDKDREKIRTAILKFADDYKDDKTRTNAEMIAMAVQDVLTLRGGAQTELLGGGDEVEWVTAGASPGNGVPDTRPDDIVTGDPKESRRRAKAAALSRLGG